MGRRAVFDSPAADLAEDLRCAGRADLHRRIMEALCGAPLDDAHVGEVTDRLAEVLADPRVPERDRQRARQLVAVADDFLGAIGRSGIAHITWRCVATDETGPEREARAVVSESEGIYQGSWGGDDSYETSPVFTSIGDALAWARERASRVVVRPWWDEGTEYWGGDDPVPERYNRLDP